MNQKTKQSLILGIESSCDETAAAIVREDKSILANVVLSQLEEHQDYGGVVPEIAARAHMEYMESVVDTALKEANITLPDVDAIAVTSGPGLIGGVIVGVMTAKAYASVHRKALLGINHLEGHALTARLVEDVPFPYLLLLVSGGHCQILAVEGVGHYRLYGTTLDDALGEAFDKTAKMMGIGYPGGPAIEKLAKLGDPNRFDFPRPLHNQKHCNFSFSGLKTAVRHCLQELMQSQGDVSEQDKADIAASFQRTVIKVVENRLQYALTQFRKDYKDYGDDIRLVVAGGVAANQAIRKQLQSLCEQESCQLIAPPPTLCTDNAAMIAWAGMERFLAGMLDEAPIEPRARWPLEELV